MAVVSPGFLMCGSDSRQAGSGLFLFPSLFLSFPTFLHDIPHTRSLRLLLFPFAFCSFPPRGGVLLYVEDCYHSVKESKTGSGVVHGNFFVMCSPGSVLSKRLLEPYSIGIHG